MLVMQRPGLPRHSDPILYSRLEEVPRNSLSLSLSWQRSRHTLEEMPRNHTGHTGHADTGTLTVSMTFGIAAIANAFATDGPDLCLLTPQKRTGLGVALEVQAAPADVMRHLPCISLASLRKLG